MVQDSRQNGPQIRIGQSLPRREDHRLLTGRGRFTANLPARDALQAVFLRSPAAHARIRSVLRRAEAEMPEVLGSDLAGNADLSVLTDAAEIDLIKCLCGWPRAVDSAVLSHEPHRLAFYLQELAAAFHLLWNKGNEDHGLRFIIPEDSRVTAARLTLIGAVAQVIVLGLGIFAVQPVEEMR